MDFTIHSNNEDQHFRPFQRKMGTHTTDYGPRMSITQD